VSEPELISLSEAAKQYQVPLPTLRTAVQRRYIVARKIGNQWVVTRQTVEQYLANRPRRGRPTKKQV